MLSLLLVQVLLTTYTTAASLRNPASFFSFGPTANLLKNVTNGPPDFPLSVSQLFGLVSTPEGQDSWYYLRSAVIRSGGALHMRNEILNAMSSQEIKQFALQTRSLGLNLSLEDGGALCGAGSGVTRGNSVIAMLKPVIANGGTLAFLLLESIFSRTSVTCPTQTLNTTATEIAEFAATVGTGVSPQTVRFFLYDALPHYSVRDVNGGGVVWPANLPSYGLDLGIVLTLLQGAMLEKGVKLEGYWMDCPYEYSRDYPNATSPYPLGSGWQRVASAVSLVHSLNLKVAKTFNTQSGGSTSNQEFYQFTLQDFKNTSQALAKAGVALDGAMVETWYNFPRLASPETTSYTSAYTALEVVSAFG